MGKTLTLHDQGQKEKNWIGTIPGLWEIIELRYVLKKSIDFRGRTPQKVDFGIQLITARNIKDGKINPDLSKEYVTEEEYEFLKKRGEVKRGDVLFTSEAPLGQVAIVTDPEIALAQRIILFRGNSLIQNLFLKYYLESSIGQSIILSRSSGSTASGIRSDKLFDIPIVVPEITYQDSIIQFLDKETTRIDTLISKKQKQIELLQEKRQAIITQAVTKGLNPDVKMKDSGVEWIGEIPEHWGVRRLKFLSDQKLVNGIFKKKDQFGSGVPLVNVFDVYSDNFIVKKDQLDLVEVDQDELKKYKVQNGDIFFVRSSIKEEGIGRSVCVLDLKKPTVFECHIVRYRHNPSMIDPKFLIYYLNSELSHHRFVAISNKVTMTTIDQNKINDFEIVFPDLDEQRKIVHEIDSQIYETESLNKKINESINLLKEYRSSLITHAVSGQIDISKYEV